MQVICHFIGVYEERGFRGKIVRKHAREVTGLKRNAGKLTGFRRAGVKFAPHNADKS